jgi:hypothetical protein
MYCDFFLPSWSTSISQSIAEQTQSLSNKHHHVFSLQPSYYMYSIVLFLNLATSCSGGHQICCQVRVRVYKDITLEELFISAMHMHNQF